MSDAKTQIACALDAAGLRERKGQIWELLQRATGRKELENGFEFSFDEGSVTIEELAHVVDLERNCCRFLRFVIIVEPEGGPLRLELGGPEGTKEFLVSLADGAKS